MASGPETECRITSQGHPRTVFRRALQRGNLLVAEAAVREVGHVQLDEALELTALVALDDRPRSRRLAARWLCRYLDETAGVTIDDAGMVAGCLAALGGPNHEDALGALRGAIRR